MAATTKQHRLRVLDHLLMCVGNSNWEIKYLTTDFFSFGFVDTRFWYVLRKSVAKEKRFYIIRSVDLERWLRATVENFVD